MKSKRSLVSALVIGISLLASGMPALAEGTFTSKWDKATEGTHSRTWNDKQLDGISTKITHSSCDRTSVKYQLTLERGFPLPDVNMGHRTASCSGTTTNRTANWGSLDDKGNYHLTIITITGGSTVSAPSLTVTY